MRLTFSALVFVALCATSVVAPGVCHLRARNLAAHRERLATILGQPIDRLGADADSLIVYTRTAAQDDSIRAALGPALVEFAPMSAHDRMSSLIAANEAPASLAPRDTFSLSSSASFGALNIENNDNNEESEGGHRARIVVHETAVAVDPTRARRRLEQTAAEHSTMIDAFHCHSNDVCTFAAANASALVAATELLVGASDAVARVERVHDVVPLGLWSSGAVDGRALSTSPRADSLTAAVAGTCPFSAECRPTLATGFTGAGVLIGVADTGLAASSCYFADSVAWPLVTVRSCLNGAVSACVPADTGHRRVRSYWIGSGGDSIDANRHGTHVCGIAAGVARSHVERAFEVDTADFDGVAPGARLVFVDMLTGASGGLTVPEPLDTHLMAHLYASGARVASFSWGAPGGYSDFDRRASAFVYAHRDFVCVVAAGNEGTAGSILSPALAKNCIAVGASNNGRGAAALGGSSLAGDTHDTLAAFSSRGSSNGAQRVDYVKPDVAAPGGYWVWAANAFSSSCDATPGAAFTNLAGTSMATPGVAGAAAIIIEYVASGSYPSTARGTSTTNVVAKSSLVRALLDASGRALGAVPVDSVDGRRAAEGGGRIELASALPVIASTALAILSNEHAPSLAAAGASHRYCVTVRSRGTRRVRIVMSYIDRPEASGATRGTIIDHLDVSVALAFSGDVIAREPLGVNGRAPGTLERRSLTERVETEVVLAAGDDASFDIVVRATSVLGPTAYSLVVTDTGSTTAAAIELDGAPHRSLTMPSTTLAAASCVYCTGDNTFRASGTCPIAPTPPPTRSPTVPPTRSPTQSPTRSPTQSPTRSPTQFPTRAPTQSPTRAPTQSPTRAPTLAPTRAPTFSPTTPPTFSPTSPPTFSPSTTTTPVTETPSPPIAAPLPDVTTTTPISTSLIATSPITTSPIMTPRPTPRRSSASRTTTTTLVALVAGAAFGFA